MRMANKRIPAALKMLAGNRLWLLAAVYVLAWLAAFVGAAVQLTTDMCARSFGTLTEQTLSLADVQPVNAYVEAENVLISENEDPQLLYTVPAGMQLKTLRFAANYDKTPYERCVYYTTEEGGAFSSSRRVWPKENADGSLTFQLPRGVKAIRLDPGSRMDLRISIKEIVLNEKRPPLSYFTPEADTLVMLLLLPGLGAAVLQCGVDAVKYRQEHRSEQAAQRRGQKKQ